MQFFEVSIPSNISREILVSRKTVLHPVDLDKSQVENEICPLVFVDKSADTPRDICQIDGRHIRSEKQNFIRIRTSLVKPSTPSLPSWNWALAYLPARCWSSVIYILLPGQQPETEYFVL